MESRLIELARIEPEDVFKDLDSRPEGLSQDEAVSRLKRYGTNEIAREKRKSSLALLLGNLKNPLVLLLAALGTLELLTGDDRAATVIFGMVALGIVLRFFQEMRADKAAEKLKAMVGNKA